MRFGGVGLIAAGVHYLTFLAISPHFLGPLKANGIAFLLAFWVSYWGHRHYSFNAQHLPHAQTLPRFFMVALLGFGLNEGLLALALNYTHISPYLALFMIILLVACITFILSKLFSFNNAS